MIDISDGLSTDLGHILEESKVSARIHKHLIPRIPDASDAQVLHGGEEYELLIIAPSLPSDAGGVTLTSIGEIIPCNEHGERGRLFLIDGDTETVLQPSGLQSFLMKHLFDNNRRWVAEMTAADPEFFNRLSGQQSPKYLWIGCADSRVPANEIVGLLPGELFVHRNVSNVVVLDDPNCLSVIQYAVDVLQVQHIIVCGHLGCGGVEAVLDDRSVGLCDVWLKHVHDVRDKTS